MNTEQKLNLIFSYQDKLIQLAERIERGYPVDSALVTNLAFNIRDLRRIIKIHA